MSGESPEPNDRIAARLLRGASEAALATAEADGRPFVSLVGLATAADGAPLMLLSGLARHTGNLAADPRASLLLRGPERAADPLAEARLTVIGTVAPSAAEADRQDYLARHPAAAGYADFGDFRFYRMAVEECYLVAGFGRIESLAPADVIKSVES